MDTWDPSAAGRRGMGTGERLRWKRRKFGGISREKGCREGQSPPTKIPPPLQAAGSGPPPPCHPSTPTPAFPNASTHAGKLQVPGSSQVALGPESCLFRNSSSVSLSSPRTTRSDGKWPIQCRRGLCEAKQFGPESQRRPGTNLCSLGTSLGSPQPHLAAWRPGRGAAGGLRWCPAPSRGRPL